jgi:chromosome segregation ATPase
MAKADGDGGADAAQTITELQERYQKLQAEKVRAETNRENAEKRLSELKAEAREKYGTDDVAELEAKLTEMKAENERKRAEYQAHLDRIESDLAAVEARFDADEPEAES